MRASRSVESESRKQRIVVGVVRTVGAFLLATALGLTAAAAPASPACAVCCPVSDSQTAVLSSPECCGEGCTEKLAAGQESACVASNNAAAGKSQVLPVAGVDPICSQIAQLELQQGRSLWLPAAARPGTLPLRL